MKKQEYFFSFITFINIVVIITGVNNALANTPDDYYELRFKTTFDSISSYYPNNHNVEMGTVLIYPKKGKRRKESFSSAPKIIKQAVLSTTTSNPFKGLYPHLYTLNNKKRLSQCPMLSFAFELDNDTNTQEWLVSSSTYFCLGVNKQGTDNDAHMWLLQKQANNHYKVLMEGDSLMIINNPSYQYVNTNEQYYNNIESYLYLNRTNTVVTEKCGGTKNKWFYHEGFYQLDKTEYHTRDCDYQDARGDQMNFYHISFIDEVKFDADKLMQPFN